MDLEAEELQSLSVSDILKESIYIPKQSPKTFYLITLSLIFPISFAILARSLVTHPIISQLQSDTAAFDWSRLLIFQFFYLISLFTFSFLSTTAVVSLYTSKPVSFSSVVVHSGDDYGVLSRIMVGGFLVGVLVIGLLVHSVLYYVCKSYHHQGIDKSMLYDHLGGYLGEYVPLNSSIQMENLDV